MCLWPFNIIHINRIVSCFHLKRVRKNIERCSCCCYYLQHRWHSMEVVATIESNTCIHHILLYVFSFIHLLRSCKQAQIIRTHFSLHSNECQRVVSPRNRIQRLADFEGSTFTNNGRWCTMWYNVNCQTNRCIEILKNESRHDITIAKTVLTPLNRLVFMRLLIFDGTCILLINCLCVNCVVRRNVALLV